MRFVNKNSIEIVTKSNLVNHFYKGGFAHNTIDSTLDSAGAQFSWVFQMCLPMILRAGTAIYPTCVHRMFVFGTRLHASFCSTIKFRIPFIQVIYTRLICSESGPCNWTRILFNKLILNTINCLIWYRTDSNHCIKFEFFHKMCHLNLFWTEWRCDVL